MIIGSNIVYYDSINSTNSEALLILKEKELPEGTVIRADFQTAGKGQKGNRWESERGKNLLLSIILYPSSVSPDQQFLISMSMSLGIYDFLTQYLKDIKIKWPNDIFIRNSKIAGILIENTIIGPDIESSVAGIGININQEKFSPEIIPDPVSLKILTGKDHDTGLCFRQLLNYLDNRYKQLLYGDRDLISKEYFSNLYRAGEWHFYKAEGIIFRGRITAVSVSGILTIEQEGRKYRKFLFREVDYVD